MQMNILNIIDEHNATLKRQTQSSPRVNRASTPVESKGIQGSVQETDMPKGFISPQFPRGWNWTDKEKAGTVCMQHMKREVIHC